MITRNLNTPESRAFWAAAERASRRVATWPAWKLGQLESREREQESMAKKIEKWIDAAGQEWSNEHYALTEDLEIAYREADHKITPPVVAAIDALHEYAHRGDKAADTQRDTGTALPEGVPPELDDWVKRWEWITARVTPEAIEKLEHDDEVRIGTRWITVWGRGAVQREVVFTYPGGSALSVEALAAIANEVRYNGR
jgi:hypothetical protein